MLASFDTVPVGTEGQYAVRKTHNGAVQYLAAMLDSSKIGRFPRELAERTCRVLTHNDSTGAFTEREDHWLPWPTDHLPYRRPVSMLGQRPNFLY